MILGFVTISKPKLKPNQSQAKIKASILVAHLKTAAWLRFLDFYWVLRL
jgi:hypothetical protein